MNDTDTTVATSDLEVVEAPQVTDLDFPDPSAAFPTPAPVTAPAPRTNGTNGHDRAALDPAPLGTTTPTLSEPTTETSGTDGEAVEAGTATVTASPVVQANDADITEIAPAAVVTPTRPAVASRHAKRRNPATRKVTRFTLDLKPEQHQFLRMFAVSNSVEASKVMRALLYLLEVQEPLPHGVLLADLVLDEIFSEEEDEAATE